jgi:hypothetical protein
MISLLIEVPSGFLKRAFWGLALPEIITNPLRTTVPAHKVKAMNMGRCQS